MLKEFETEYGKGLDEPTTLRLLPPQADLPPGRTYECSACRTRVREGQPHTASEPHPHQTYAALIHNEVDCDPNAE